MDQAVNLVDVDPTLAVRVSWEIFEECAAKIAAAAPSTTPWRQGELLVNLSGYGLPPSALEVVASLSEIHTRVVVQQEPVGQKGAGNFCQAVLRILFNLREIAEVRLQGPAPAPALSPDQALAWPQPAMESVDGAL